MFDYLDGMVTELFPALAVIDCGGVGYACKTTSYTLSSLARGQRGKVYTYLHVGEGVFDLYGFATRSERDSFQMLLGVSGVGPRAALAILSANTPETLAMAIVSDDEQSLTRTPGVGKKTARRMILELKDKIAKQIPDFSSQTGAPTNRTAEAAQALMVLGYSAQEAGAALRGIDTERLALEEIIRQALKRLAI